MAVKYFTPLNEDLLDRWRFDEALVPYQPGLPIISQLSIAGDKSGQSRSRISTSPALTPSSAALPALSSSTYLAGPALG